MSNSKRVDINIGDRFGSLTVIGFKRFQSKINPKHSLLKVELKCDCGNIIYGAPFDVKAGKYKKCKECEPNSIPIGTRFGKLVVIDKGVKDASLGKGNHYLYKCKCDCGNTTLVSKGNLLTENVKSCGCGKFRDDNSDIGRINHKKRDFYPGEKVGKLTIIKRLTGNDSQFYICDCDCGNKGVKVSRGTLDKSEVPSCGCNNKYGTTAFKNQHPEVLKYIMRAKSILDRCRVTTNPAFSDYGGRGIVCELGNTQTEVAYSLSKIPGFSEDLELDRIDPNGNYTIEHPIHGKEVWYYEDPNDGQVYPALGNLRWVSRLVNASNIDKHECVYNRLRSMNSAKRIIGNYNISSYKFIKVDFTYYIRNKFYEPLYLVVPLTMPQVCIDKMLNKFKSFYDYWDNYRKNNSYNYSLNININD